MVLNAVFFPFVLAIVALASALSAPLLPLFTLPVFLVGFSRQSRFWPDNPGVYLLACVLLCLLRIWRDVASYAICNVT